MDFLFGILKEVTELHLPVCHVKWCCIEKQINVYRAMDKLVREFEIPNLLLKAGVWFLLAELIKLLREDKQRIKLSIISLIIWA